MIHKILCNVVKASAMDLNLAQNATTFHLSNMLYHGMEIDAYDHRVCLNIML